MTGGETLRALDALERQATELACDLVRNIAEIRARLLILQEIQDFEADQADARAE